MSEPGVETITAAPTFTAGSSSLIRYRVSPPSSFTGAPV